MDRNDTILAARDIAKSFGPVRAVDGVTFEVGRGRIVGLLGRNGAGKTTTLRMCNGIFLPDRGSIELFGSASHAAARDRVGYLPEERGLYKQMKLVELLLFMAEIRGRKAAFARPRIDEWLQRFELTDKRNARLEELSKGNQQKVQLAAALIHDPELVILDEPMSGLDPVNVVLVRRLIRELRSQGKAILLSTHMMVEAEKTVDDILLIHRGQVVLHGPLGEVKRAHGHGRVHLDFDGDGAFLKELSGVEAATIQQHSAELTLVAGTDGQAILAACLPRLRVKRYEVAEPSLEEIFMAKAGTESLPAAAPVAATA